MKTFSYMLGSLAISISMLSFGATLQVKDMAYIEGVRSNQLIGYGVVSGLDGTGDTNSTLTNDSTINLLKSLGIAIPVGNTSFKNVAVVTLTSEIPPFSRIGQKIDVTVSSIGSAKSIKSGILMLTPLKGVDGQVYALAQGNVVIADSKGNQLVGTIQEGATIEKEVNNDLSQYSSVNLTLKNADFSNIQYIQKQIKSKLDIDTQALDARVLTIPLPQSTNDKVARLASIMSIPMEHKQVEDISSAKIMINTKLNTVILNKDIYINSCQINIGNISINVDPKLKATSETINDKMLINTDKPKFNDVIISLRKVGATIQDIMNISQSLKKSQCIQADIEII